MMTGDPDHRTALPYRSAQAFGAALTDRLKTLAAHSRYTVSQLRRQFAYDRLLARVFTSHDADWVLKGGVAMLARLSVARHSADIDLVTHRDSPTAALPALREAAARDLGDFFTFRLDPPRSLVQQIQGIRVPTEARLGPRLFERFAVDLVTGAVITGDPETAPPLLAVDVPGLVRPAYRVYPLADTLADKVAAIIEDHHGRPSTRFRDLVDIVLIAHDQPVDSAALTRALASERFRRGLRPRSGLEIPDAALWHGGYVRAAGGIPELVERDLDQALVLAKTFLDPILTGERTRGTWNPATLAWE